MALMLLDGIVHLLHQRVVRAIAILQIVVAAEQIGELFVHVNPSERFGKIPFSPNSKRKGRHLGARLSRHPPAGQGIAD